MSEQGPDSRLKFFPVSFFAMVMGLTGLSIATLGMYQLTGGIAFAVVGWGLLTLVTLVVVYLLYLTARAVSRNEICVPAV